jgi:hypothetical protein
MWTWVTAQYRRRLVNINVNITVASVLAALGGAFVIHFTRYIGVQDDDKTILMIVSAAADWLIDLVVAVGLHWVANHWPESWRQSKTIIEKAEDVLDSAPPPGWSILKDATAGTHLPHIPGFKPEKPDPTCDPARSAPQHGDFAAGAAGGGGGTNCGVKKVGFVRDATRLQLQRLMLSPIFYGIAMGGEWMMLKWGMAREVSVIVPFGLAILVTRLLHTVWLLWSDPQILQEWEDWQRQRRAREAAEDAKRAAAHRL